MSDGILEELEAAADPAQYTDGAPSPIVAWPHLHCKVICFDGICIMITYAHWGPLQHWFAHKLALVLTLVRKAGFPVHVQTLCDGPAKIQAQA